MDDQEPSDSSNTTTSEDLKPTSKGVEKAKKRLQAFSIQKKSLSPVAVPLPKPICTNVGAVGTVFIGKLASSKPLLKPGDIEDVVDPKKPQKPPKPGTSKQNVTYPLADYLNSQKKTLCEIEAMKRKMELVDLGIPLGLICPAPDEKAMPTKAMPPIKSMMLDPAKVDEIIREAKKARAEGKTFKFSYEKLLPSYQNPFARNKQKFNEKERERSERDLLDDRPSRDRRRLSDNYRRYSDKRARDRPDDDRRRVIRERDEKIRNRKGEKPKRDGKSKEKNKSKEREIQSKDRDFRSKEKDDSSKELKSKVKDSKSKDKINTINLSDVDDDDVEFVTAGPAKVEKEADVNLIDYVICDSWSENEEKNEPTEAEKKENDESQTAIIKHVDPMEQLKESLKARPAAIKIQKLKPVTDSFKFEIDDNDNDEETLDIFSENATLQDFAKIPLPAKMEPYSPSRFDHESKDISVDGIDDSFLESVIAEIKQGDIDDDVTQDKGLVEYDMSPKDERESVTPEIDDRIRELYSSRSDYSDGFKSVESVKSTESGRKSTESGYKSTESGYKSAEGRSKSTSNIPNDRSRSERNKSNDRSQSVDSLKSTENCLKSNESDRKSTKAAVETMPKTTVDSLETWSFVLKICQPLLFRHDRNKCYKETRALPKIWYAENPKTCNCVKDRSVVYDELEMCKMDLVHTVYRNDRVQDDTYPAARGWYPESPLCASGPIAPTSEWEAEDSQERPTPPRVRPRQLDIEYQKFMEAVLDVGTGKSETPPKTPVREVKKRTIEETEAIKKKKPRIDSSEGWSQDSEDEEQKIKKQKVEKVKRKRKHSPSGTDSENTPSKKKKKEKKEKKEKSKIRAARKRQRLGKKYLKRLKEKQEKQLRKKKRLKMEEEADIAEKEKKKRDKKLKRKKLLKQKKKAQKKRKSRTSSETESDSDRKSKKKDKRKKRNKRKQSSSESAQSDEFDVNILKNIKTERLTDDEAKTLTPKKHREIINVKQLQNDFVSIQIKKEVDDVNSSEQFGESFVEDEKREIEVEEKRETEIEAEKGEAERIVEEENKESEFLNKEEHKEPEYTIPEPPKPPQDDTTQSSSQDSVISVKEYEKDDSHLRPSSQNSNYNFHDVMQSEGHMERSEEAEMESYEQGNYEMYEQMAMEYQSDVASQRVPPPDEQTSGRIETVALTRNRGEIKCDWRAGDPSDPVTSRPSRWENPQRPSRWGLKPSEVNIVLTGGNDAETSETFAIQSVVSPAVYKIQSLANRKDNSNSGYDEAYMDMYGASDRLQYGDCFSAGAQHTTHSSLDERINQALNMNVIDDAAKDDTEISEGPDKGILVTKALLSDPRCAKRVSFADGYKPGQDSDTEEPPVRKKKKVRRLGCPWPCPLEHPDHVPLWDALPPPPPPGSPPPPQPAPLPAHLLREGRRQRDVLQVQMPVGKFDPGSLVGFMPPEPPPGLISF